MAVISAEAYARLCGEQELRTPDGEWGPPREFPERVRALMVVGLLSPEVASNIVAEYARARMLRGLQGYSNGSADFEQRAVVDRSQPIRVARCSAEFRIGDGTVRLTSVILQRERTRFLAQTRYGPAAVRRGLIYRAPAYASHTFTVADDTARTASVTFAWGGDLGRTAWYNAWTGLSPGTAWLDVDGVRLVLDDADVGATATVATLLTERSSSAERATRYLRHYALGTPTHEPLPPLAVIADTFVGCGVLPSDSPAVRSALQSDERTRRPSRPTADASQPSRKTVVVGATTLPIDCVRVTVVELTLSSNGDFSIEVDGCGAADLGENHRPLLNRPRLAIWATDDSGNRYRGSLGEFDFGMDGFCGTINFQPQLDSEASVVDLEFDTDHAQATVRIPLPLSHGS